jgi:hypothetical protein
MRSTISWAVLSSVLSSVLVGGAAQATGHGPVYGLATPTLPEGAWSLDVGAMYRLMGDVNDTNAHAAMLRPMVGYGINEDLELSLSAPLPLYSRRGARSSRMMGMMPATMDVEALLAWRFHRNTTGVGARLESTTLFGLVYPTGLVNGVEAAPGFVAGAVTGYASRSVYAWAGAVYRRYMTASGPGSDHPGDQLLYSVVLGYRPGIFRRELPHADWRFFVEAVGEWTARDRVQGNAVSDSGGHQIFVGPTVLGLFGAWGISGGPQFRVYGNVNGMQRQDSIRLVTNYTCWF